MSDLKIIFASYCFSSPAKLFLTFYGALNVHLQWTFNVVLLILITKNKFWNGIVIEFLLQKTEKTKKTWNLTFNCSHCYFTRLNLKQERHTVPWPRANIFFFKYHEKIKEYFDFNKTVQFQIEKWEERKTFQLEKRKYSNEKMENIPIGKWKIFQIDKGKNSN